jgi:hypothetical protein
MSGISHRAWSTKRKVCGSICTAWGSFKARWNVGQVDDGNDQAWFGVETLCGAGWKALRCLAEIEVDKLYHIDGRRYGKQGVDPQNKDNKRGGW